MTKLPILLEGCADAKGNEGVVNEPWISQKGSFKSWCKFLAFGLQLHQVMKTRARKISCLIGILGTGFVLLSACSASTTAQSGTGFTCSVSSATVVSGTSQLLLALTASGGTANYNVVSVNANGVTGSYVSGTQSFPTTGSATYLFNSLTAATLATGSGTVNITDSASPALSTSCGFSLGSPTTTGAIACTMTPAITSPTIGQSDTFNISVTSGGTAPYTFSNFIPGTYGTAISPVFASGMTTATATASYSQATTANPSVQVSDSAGNTGTCTTPVYVGGTTGGTPTGGALSCTATLSPNSIYRGHQVTASVIITGSGAGNVKVSTIKFPSAAGVYGAPGTYNGFTSATSASLIFPYPSVGNPSFPYGFLITMVIEDANGTTSSCGAYETVN